MSMTKLNEANVAPDPFADVKSLRLSQDFATGAGVKKLLTTVPVRKPGRQDFFRVNPDPAYRLSPAAILELRDDGEVYLVLPSVAPELPGEFVSVTLFWTINRQGVVSLWPVRLPTPEGRYSDWHRSAGEAAELAMTRWIRLRANLNLGAYEIFEAEAKVPEPVWPEISFPEILKIAFRDRLVDRIDHPVLKRLRGAL
jgi:hypothetical protein